MQLLKKRLFNILFLILVSVGAFAQGNITDEKGNKQGPWEKKDSKGNLVYKGTFTDNRPVGEFVYYDSTGKVKAITEFSANGSKAYSRLFERGYKISEGLYINERKEGIWKYFNPDSVVIAEERYINGIPDGVWKTYYANGSIYEEVTYVKGIKEGPWIQYFFDGPIKTKATYKNGLLQGLATFYHPNGRVFISGPYVDNLKDGIWMHMDDKGVAVKREVWSSGFLTAEEYYDKAAERLMKEEK